MSWEACARTGCCVLFLIGINSAGRADAQTYAGLYLGANQTQPADVTISQPSLDAEIRFRDVAFAAHPFESPQYYGWRAGRMFGRGRSWGLEFEFIHLKVFAIVDRTYETSGVSFIATVPPPYMDAVVQRYSMTHGLNFALANVVRRLGSTGPVSFAARAGLGPTIPHAETTIGHVSQQQYEYGGLGAQAAAGAEFRLHSRVTALAEYKFTFARPEIELPNGTGVTTSATHHVAFGLTFLVTR